MRATGRARARAMWLASAACAFLPAAASAQDVRDLDAESSDVRVYTGEVSTTPVVYSYTIPPQTTLRVDVVPEAGSELDPMVTVTDAATGELLAEDDDGGGGVAARAQVYSEAGRQVEITVTAFGFLSDQETYGPFQLQLRENARDLASVREVGFGENVDAAIDTGEGRLFSIAGEEGQLLRVAMVARGGGIDPFLEIYEGEGMTGAPLAVDDDGGNELNSLLRFVFPETGTYTIRATSYDGETGGEFTLRVAEASVAEVQMPSQAIGLDERMRGRLGEGYETGTLDPAEIVYQLTDDAMDAIRRGNGEVTFNMTTPLFEDDDFPSGVDPYLELGFETPLGYAAVMTDDDGGEGLNSRIAVDLSPLAGEGDWLERLRIRAGTVAAGGEFEMELAEGMQEVEDSAETGEFIEEFEELGPAPPIRVQPPGE